MILLDPLACPQPGARGIMKIILAVVIKQVGTSAEAKDHAVLEFFGVEIGTFASVVKVLVGNELPGFDLNIKTDSRAAIGVYWKFVSVPGTLSFKITLHDMAG